MAVVVLALVFLDELAAWAAYGVWGFSLDGPLRWVVGLGLPLVVVVLWALLASPRALYGGRGVRPVVKLLVYAGAVAALWAAGHPTWALLLAVASVLLNAAAQLPGVRATLAAQEHGRVADGRAAPRG